MMVPNVTPYAELQGLFALVAISSAAFTAWALLSWWVFDCRAVRISSAMLVSSCWVAIAAAGYYNLQQYGAFEQAITSTRSREVDHDVYRLASVTRADLGDGYQFHSEYYTDGSVKTRGQVPIGEGRASRHFGGTEAWNEGDAGATGRPAQVHDWREFDRHAAGQRF